jgi:hypothetical protein
MGGKLRRPPVPHRLAVAVLLAAVLLAASTVTGCSTATRPTARSATSAAATTLAHAAPATTTSAKPAPGPATNEEPAAPGAAGSQGARYVFPVPGCRVSYGHSHSYYPATDIFTDRGCAFVAPTDGAVDEVNLVDRWDPTSDRGGLSVSIIESTASDTTAPTCSRLRRASPTAPAYAPGTSWAASTTPATHAPPRPMSTSACPGRPHRASGGSAAVLCTPGATWMPGALVATSLQLRRSKPPTPPPAATSQPVASAARFCVPTCWGTRLAASARRSRRWTLPRTPAKTIAHTATGRAQWLAGRLRRRSGC